jgi:hypothetical protein
MIKCVPDRRSCLQIVRVVIVALLAGSAQAAAVNLRLTPDDIQRALTLARWPTSDAERLRFHERYVLTVNSPTIEYFAVQKVEVITEFRRLELIAEEHARINDTFGRGGLRDVEAALAPWRGLVTIVVTLIFDSTKYITGVPAVDMVLEGPTLIAPLDTAREGLYGGGDRPSLIGGIVRSTFDAASIGQAVRPVFIHRGGKPIARPAIDFATLE